MAATIVGVFQPEMQNLIKDSKILLVGSGGIGCEVLKNLVLTGFSDLEVIDLDTIEVSNLNRQFLFNKHSVGKAKSHVARESVLKFNPNVNIKSHLGNIMDQTYGSVFFNKFKLVINALDNKKARAHVNRMCLSVNVPLIESGTMGYNGQVEFIKKGESLCYECMPKPEPKSYPMCTIRNTPKEPIHCIVWSKFLFNQLFGEPETDDDVSMEVYETEESPRISAREWSEKNNYEPSKMFTKIFIDDVKYLLSMEDLFKNRGTEPIPMHESLLSEEYAEYKHEPDFKILELSQYVSMFKDCIANIKTKFDKSNGKNLVWDKDDEDFMNFIVCCTNLRSTIFELPLKTHFDIKSMAGNIVPAIATANAIIAGQIVIHALRALRGNYDSCQSVYLRAKPNHKGGILVKDKKLEAPNPNCFVCSVRGELILRLDITSITVRQLDELILKKKLNLVLPDVMVDDRLLISSNEDDELDLYSNTLCRINVKHGSRLTVDDYFQNYSVTIMIHHRDQLHKDHPDFEIFNSIEDMMESDRMLDLGQGTITENDDDCVMENIEQVENNASKVHGNFDLAKKDSNEIATTSKIHREYTPETDMMQVMVNEPELSDEKKSLMDNGDQEVSDEKEKPIDNDHQEVSDEKKSPMDNGDQEVIDEKESPMDNSDQEVSDEKEPPMDNRDQEVSDEKKSPMDNGDQEVSDGKESPMDNGDQEVSDGKESPMDNGDQEVSNEELLALKRKAENDTEEETSEPKKSRIDE